MDGASLPRIYWRVILPILRPVVFSTTLVLSHLSIKSFDLVMALTAGGPGFASDMPATFMYVMSFTRGQIGLGASQCHHDVGNGRGHCGALPVQRVAFEPTALSPTAPDLEPAMNQTLSAS